MSKKRYYVVWNGLAPGVYETWSECESQIKGVKQALYKSFETLAEAERAYNESPYLYINHGTSQKKETKKPEEIPDEMRCNALAVDAACSGNPGKMEYRGVYLATGEEIFRVGPIIGTNNIGEFLAIVHGLALLAQKNSNIPIFSDSRNALLWIKQKKCKTKLEQTEKTKEVFELIERAEKWLQNHTYKNKLIKWETSRWGEIPADFGRK